MENVILIAGLLIALAMIVRFATKKVGYKGRVRSTPRTVVAGYAYGTAASQMQRATFGTVIGVNVICLVGFIIALVFAMTVNDTLVRLICSMGTLLFTPWVACKFLESQDGSDTFTPMGALASFCIMFWIFGSMWYLGDAIEIVRSVTNG